MRTSLRRYFPLAILSLFLITMLSPVTGSGQVKTFTVNMTSDESDPNAGNVGDDFACDIDPITPGDQCTLRAAIENHNGNRNLGTNEIKFDIPNAPGSGSIIIKVGSSGNGPFPWILGSVIIKAKNEPDQRRIEIDGTMAGGGAIGLVLRGGNCQISSFVINNFSSHGMVISGTPPPGDGGHIIKGNFIGTDSSGRVAKPNGGDGIFIENTGGNTIGGVTFDDLNVISGNKGYGIEIHGSDPQVDFQVNGARNNNVKGNFIGLDIDGNLVLKNQRGGILDENAPSNRFGDSTNPKAANKLAGSENGITVKGDLSEGVSIEGNFFQNKAGAKFKVGIFGRGGRGLTISGNVMDDIDSTAIDLFMNANGIYNVRKNKLVGGYNTGFKARFAPGKEFEVDYNGNFSVGPRRSIDVQEAIGGKIDWIMIGDTLRAGQEGANIVFRASGKKIFNSNTYEGMAGFGINYVVDLASGVQATLSETNEVYKNNHLEGLHGRIQGSGELALTLLGNKASGNGTGTRVDFFVGAGAKVDVAARQNEYIFSADAGFRIVSDGKNLDLVKFVYERNLLDHDNFVGLDVLNFLKVLGKSITNDTITNNGGPGIRLSGNTQAHIDQNIISGNKIGILINDVAKGTIVTNTVTGNGTGIALAGTAIGTLISGNRIFNNTGLGIDLGNDGVTANHSGGPIAGPNGFLNKPVLTDVAVSNGNTIIKGAYNGAANTSYNLEFFYNAACSVTGFGEGENFLDSARVTTDGTGNISFVATLVGKVVPNGVVVTATATDPNNNTSEFSACKLVGTSVVTVFYSKSSGDLNNVLTWGSNTNGTGSSPADFAAGKTFNLANRGTVYTLTNNWSVDGIINIPVGSQLQLNGKTLSEAGVTGTGTITGSATSNLIITGLAGGNAGTHYFSTGAVLNNLTLLRSGASASATIGSSVNIYSVLTVNNGTLNTGNFITLKSTATNTARVAPVGASAGITGDVTVERFIPARKAWRLMSAPVAGTQTINAAWQEGVTTASPNPNPNPGFGVQITGGTLANGFDQTATSSIKKYNSSTDTWIPLANTNATAVNSDAFMLFIAGDRTLNPANTTSPATSTILRSRGPVRTGNQTFPVSATGFTAVPNPFASPINFVTITKNNLQNSFYVWDPKMAGPDGVGGWVNISWNGSSYDVTPAAVSPESQYIQSGQGFMVHSTGVAGSIVIKETDKAAVPATNVFRSSNIAHGVRITLQSVEEDGVAVLDEVFSSYSPAFSDDIDNLDVVKLANIQENLGIVRSGNVLMVERRSAIRDNDTIALALSNTSANSYRFEVNAINLSSSVVTASLEDLYQHTSTAVSLSGITRYDFTINKDAASKNPYRFSLILRSKNAQRAAIVRAESSITAYPNPVTNGIINITFQNQPKGLYTVQLLNSEGSLVFSTTIQHEGGTATKAIQLRRNLSKGIYQLNVAGLSSKNTIKIGLNGR
jgi:CSLREA domain-containing protein